MLIFLIILFAAISIHLATIATVGRVIGVTVRAISLGFGPTIFELGVFRVGAFPTGGYVSFRDSRKELVPSEESKTSLDGRSTIEQIAISVSGCFTLLMVGVIATGADGVAAFLTFPLEVLAGASSPLNEAQTLLQSSSVFVHSAPIGTLVGILCAKLSALNLLPFPAMNGGAAIAVLGHRLGADNWWPPFATRFLAFIFFALFASWCFALLAYVSES